MLGGLAAKFRWRRAREAAGKDTARPNLVCGSVQICWHKFATFFDVEMRQVPMEPGVFTMTPEQVVEHCDENTIAVVATFGQTYTGLYEDVEGISRALDDLQQRPAWMSRCTSTARAGRSWARSSGPRSSGTSDCRG